MGIKVRIVQQAARTTTGLQTFTVSGLGDPGHMKGAIFMITRATAVNTTTDHAVHSFGMTDGTNHRVACAADEHGVGNVVASNWIMNDQVIAIITPSPTISVDGEAAFDSWITDGIRINWGNAPAAAYLVTCILFADDGSDLSLKVGDTNLTGTQDSEVSETGVGFKPDQVLFIVQDIGTRPWSFDALETHMHFCLGIASNEASVKNVSLVWGSINGSGSQNPSAHQATTRCIQKGLFGSPSSFEIAAADDFLANGFTVTKRDSTASLRPAWMALAFNGAVDFWAGSIDSPTDPGNWSPTAPGFKPQFVMLGTSQLGVSDSHVSNDDGGPAGISVFTASEQACISWTVDDGAGTMDTSCKSDSSSANGKCINQDDHAGVVDFEANFSTMDSTGWTLDFNTVNGATKKWIGWAIEEVGGAPPAGLSIKIAMHHYKQQMGAS